MGTKYTSQSATGYNASPPSDDGTAVASNEIKWSIIKPKLADPVKTLADDINAALLLHLDETVLDKGVAYTATAAEHKRTINITASATQDLGDASTMGVGYIVHIKNSHTAANTIGRATGADTIDGVAGDVALGENESASFIVNSTADGYHRLGQSFPSGTLMLFQQTAAPTGWTKETTHNDKALRVVTGAASSGGTNAFSTALNTAFAGAGYTLLEADIPAHTHGASGTHTHQQRRYTAGSLTGDNPAEPGSGFTTVADPWDISTGAGGDHTHTSFGGSGSHAHDVDLDVLYVDLIIASKD